MQILQRPVPPRILRRMELPADHCVAIIRDLPQLPLLPHPRMPLGGDPASFVLIYGSLQPKLLSRWIPVKLRPGTTEK